MNNSREGNLFKEGELIENSGHPDWGPGKVVSVNGQNLHVIFRDLEEEMARIFRADSKTLRLAQTQSDPILDNLPPLAEKDGRWILPAKRITLESAKRRFLHEFPAGFADPKYMEGERDYKLAAHLKFQQRLGLTEIKNLMAQLDYRALAQKALKVVSAVNLLSPYESAAFHDAMRDDDAVQRLFTALLALFAEPRITEHVFESFANAIDSLPAARGKVATWPVATIFPYLAEPDRYMFLKPAVTKVAAEALGFDLKYRPELNWPTYDSLQRMGRIYLELLRSFGARDFVDVQSFIWVTCGGYDASTSNSQVID